MRTRGDPFLQPGERARKAGRILAVHSDGDGVTVYFFELHEGDKETFSDVLLVHDEEFTPNEFLDLVQEVREQVRDRFEEDTLTEAIAVELERLHGFTYVGDHRLSASVHVSADEEETYLTEIDERGVDLDDADDRPEPEYRGIFVEFDRDRDVGPH